MREVTQHLSFELKAGRAEASAHVFLPEAVLRDVVPRLLKGFQRKRLPYETDLGHWDFIFLFDFPVQWHKHLRHVAASIFLPGYGPVSHLQWAEVGCFRICFSALLATRGSLSLPWLPGVLASF